MNDHAAKHVAHDPPVVIIRSWSSRIFSIVLLLLLGLVLFMELDRNRLTEDILAMEGKISELNASLSASKRELEELKPDVHEEMVSWAYSNAKNYVPKSEIRKILAEAKKYKSYIMIISVIKEESQFDQYAKSKKDAKGLGQIMPSVWTDELKEAGIWQEEIDAFDYRKNIAAMDYILSKYKKHKGSWRKALNEYVNGDNAYVTRVLSNYAELALLMNEIDPQQASTILENTNAGDTKVPQEKPRSADGKPPAEKAIQPKGKKTPAKNVAG